MAETSEQVIGAPTQKPDLPFGAGVKTGTETNPDPTPATTPSKRSFLGGALESVRQFAHALGGGEAHLTDEQKARLALERSKAGKTVGAQTKPLDSTPPPTNLTVGGKK